MPDTSAAKTAQPSLAEEAALVVSHKRGCGKLVAAGLVAGLDEPTLRKIVAADDQPGGDHLVDRLLPKAEPPQRAEPVRVPPKRKRKPA